MTNDFMWCQFTRAAYIDYFNDSRDTFFSEFKTLPVNELKRP